MNVNEFNNEFDLLYDNANSSAPGLDMYEKSVYLTKAQLELFKSKYGKANPSYGSFEGSEKRRTDLANLITNYVSTKPESLGNKGVTSSSVFFAIPSDFCYAIQESATLDIPNCAPSTANVLPKTHDEVNTQLNNPFKKPNAKVAWRLDYFDQDSNERVIEIVSNFTVLKYQTRYLRYPKPIILEDLNGGLSIEGEATSRTSELDESIHGEILDRAVELATRDYKEQKLNGQLQTNLRNE